MTLWVILLRGDDYTWVETAWDDDSTAENPYGWQEVVGKARDTAAEGGYDMRIVEVHVPGMYDAFDIPELKGKVK